MLKDMAHQWLPGVGYIGEKVLITMTKQVRVLLSIDWIGPG